MKLILNEDTGLTVEVHMGTIGPRHDPYATTTVTLALPDGTRVEEYTDGLGTNRWRFFHDYQSAPVREEEWFSPWSQAEPKEVQRAKAMDTKMNLLTKRLMGVGMEEAEEAFLDLVPKMDEDPMGPASRYI